MNRETPDNDIAALLGHRQAAEHAPTFWAAVRSDLDAVAAERSAGGPAASRGRAVADGREDASAAADILDLAVTDPSVRDDGYRGDDGDVGGDDPTRRPTRRRQPLVLLAAAAVVLVAVVGVGLATRDDAKPVDVVTEPTVTDPPDPDPTVTDPPGPDPTAPTGAMGALVGGDETEISTGRVVAMDPDGVHLYVSDLAGSDRGGCEGTPSQALYVQAADGSGRIPALPDVDVITSGGVEMAFGPDGLVAVKVSCEGFLSHLLTGRMNDDGSIDVLNDATIPDLDADPVDGSLPMVDAVVDMAWRQRELVISTFSFGNEHRHLFTMLPEPGELIDLGRDGTVVFDLDGQAAAGGPGLVTASTDGTITGVDGSVLGSASSPTGIDVLDDGTVVVTTADEFITFGPGAGDPVAATGIGRTDFVGRDVVYLDYLDDGSSALRSTRFEVDGSRPGAEIRAATGGASSGAQIDSVVLSPDAATAYVGLVDVAGETVEYRVVAIDLSRDSGDSAG